MARQLTTKAQVNGYRFLLRRLEHALVRRDVRMLHDPMRSQLQALVVGTVLGLLVLGGCGVWGLIRPQGAVGDAKILVSKDTGAGYVIVDDTLHPVLNLASARLIAASSESPTSVSDDKLAAFARGPLLGLPGAPDALPAAADESAGSTWTVCDSATASTATDRGVVQTVIGGPAVLGERIDPTEPGEAVLVTVGLRTYLIYGVPSGEALLPVRAEVDTTSVPVMRALGLEGAEPRPMSPGLLNTFPEVDPLAVPAIRGAGRSGPGSIADTPVGSVVRSVGVDGVAGFYVVLADGIQKVSAVTAEMVRLADRAGTPMLTVPPGRLAEVPTVSVLPVADFPARAPELLGEVAEPTLCRTWSRGPEDPRAVTAMLSGTGLPLAPDARPVPLISADGPGPGVDAVYLRPGTGAYVQVTGDEPESTRTGSTFYVSDSGVRFGIPDAPTAGVLGLGDTPSRAPWSVVSLLAAGPTLSRHAALVAHAAVAPDAEGVAVSPPQN